MSKVKDIMTTELVTAETSCELADAARLMRDADVGMLPVVEGGQLLGVVTDRDLVIRGLAGRHFEATVGEIMGQKSLVCLSPDDDEKDAERLMAENDVRRLPVVENGRLVGVVSVGDLAVRADADRAGKVMEKTGPEKN